MSSSTTPKTVLLKGKPGNREGIANAAITPGMLIEQMSTGKFRAHATAGGVHPAKYFAREQEWTGGALDTAYAGDDRLPYLVCGPGDQVYALVPAGAAAIVIGDLLESNGDGRLRKAANYLTDNSGGTANTTLQDIGAAPTEAEVANNFADVAAAINRLMPGAVARAIEAVDNSGGGAAVRIRVEVI
jgi:hypothetical protein